MSTPIQQNASDDLELAIAEQLESELAREQFRADREQLSHYEGRAWVWGQIEDAGVFRDISGPLEAVYAALGQRKPGLKLLLRCQAHPDLFMQMWQEALKRRKDRREYVATTRKVKQQQTKQPRAA
jgi:hypothetical protein